jgi:hypothetical protein
MYFAGCCGRQLRGLTARRRAKIEHRLTVYVAEELLG